MKSPYIGRPGRSFWRKGVVARPPETANDMYRPRFKVEMADNVVTAGSCFAQHVGRALREAKYRVIDAEPLTAQVSRETAQKFGYRLYSARYGNIYTSKQLLQLYLEAIGEFVPANAIWEKAGRFYDAMRPSVEPNGLDTRELVIEHREQHLQKVRTTFQNADVFVFTFGLTETWIDRKTGTAYPTAPGTIAGEYDPEIFAFKNLSYNDVLADFTEFRRRLMEVNPDVKFMITVSPVPLAATATDLHVEVATARSKAVLRAVCGELYDSFGNVDYFPSYEIITSQNNGGRFYAKNQRDVTPAGVAVAMGEFLTAHGSKDRAQAPEGPAQVQQDAHEADDDLVCEEALLDAFSDSDQR